MMYYLKVLLVIIPLLILSPVPVFGATYTQTVDFDSNQAYTYNTNWMHSLSQIPQGYIIKSAQITLRVKVWYWGWNTYEQNIDIMASDTTSFTLPQDRICELNSSTNPNPSAFYTVTCQISSDKLEFIKNDGQIYIGTNTYGGTYYLDYSTITVIASQPAKGDFNGDWKPDILWRNTTSGENAVWYLNGTTVSGFAVLDSMPDQSWEIVGTGDFNNDGKVDILWRNTTSGQNAIWFMNGTTVTGFAGLDSMTDQSWEIVAHRKIFAQMPTSNMEAIKAES